MRLQPSSPTPDERVTHWLPTGDRHQQLPMHDARALESPLHTKYRTGLLPEHGTVACCGLHEEAVWELFAREARDVRDDAR